MYRLMVRVRVRVRVLLLPCASPEGLDNDARGCVVDLRINISIGTNSVACDLGYPPVSGVSMNPPTPYYLYGVG
jgi:hypothetical protein